MSLEEKDPGAKTIDTSRHLSMNENTLPKKIPSKSPQKQGPSCSPTAEAGSCLDELRVLLGRSFPEPLHHPSTFYPVSPFSHNTSGARPRIQCSSQTIIVFQ
ncbi:hypothetical protein Q8A73_005439 [Channa argus]|nr:hypothetical protein Q8A73_005439 [Channa argus]